MLTTGGWILNVLDQIQQFVASVGASPIETREDNKLSTKNNSKKKTNNSNNATNTSKNIIVKGEESDALITYMPSLIILLVVLVGITTSIWGMGFTVSIIADVAAVCCVVLGPYGFVQKVQLRHLGSLRYQQNQVRKTLNKLDQQNNVLLQERNKLQAQQQKLKSIEKDYERICKTSKVNLERIETVVRERRIVQAQLKKRLEARIIQDVMQAVLMSDTDEDFEITPKEFKRLELKLGSIPGIRFNRNKFRQCVSKDGTVALVQVMEVIRNLVNDDVPEEDNIFVLEAVDVLGSYYTLESDDDDCTHEDEYYDNSDDDDDDSVIQDQFDVHHSTHYHHQSIHQKQNGTDNLTILAGPGQTSNSFGNLFNFCKPKPKPRKKKVKSRGLKKKASRKVKKA